MADPIVEQFLDALRAVIADVNGELLPETLFSTFDYTTTGKNFSHPRVWGACVKAAWELVDDGGIVEIDSRLNNRSAKFQPDLLVRARDNTVRIAVDIESPNSSDARLFPKDVEAYLGWGTAVGFPYLVVTMLPRKRRTPGEWQIRWTSPKYYNAGHGAYAADIRANPFDYWYSVLVERVRAHPDHGVYFANFDGRTLELVDLTHIDGQERDRLVPAPVGPDSSSSAT
jgi:hypothetical protein